MEKYVLNTKEFVEMFGSDLQKEGYAKWGRLQNAPKNAMLKKAKRKFNYVDTKKVGNRVYYLIAGKKAIEDRDHIKGVVYLATNTVNGKRYVGCTTNNLKNRKRQHLYDSSNPSRLIHDLPLYRAIREYGEDAFKWEILELEENKEELHKLECYYIVGLETYNPHKGYNHVIGKWVKF